LYVEASESFDYLPIYIAGGIVVAFSLLFLARFCWRRSRVYKERVKKREFIAQRDFEYTMRRLFGFGDDETIDYNAYVVRALL
jgi:hypothetical protein